MTYVLFYMSIISGFVKKHSRVVEMLILVVIWLLSAFATGNADSGIYEGRYNFYQSYAGMSEMGWQALMVAFNGIGMDYQSFRCLLIAVELLFIYLGIHRLTDNPNFVLAAYLIYPLCLDIVQMRFALASSIAFLGMSFLFEPLASGMKGTNRRSIVFILLVVIASLFHFISIIYLLLLFVPHLDSGKSLVVAVFVCVFSGLLLRWSGIAGLAASVGLGTKFETLQTYDTSTIVKSIGMVVLTATLWTVAFLVACQDSSVQALRNAAIRTNWLVIAAIVPLMPLAVDFYRIQQGISILNLCLVSRSLDPEQRLAFSKKNVLIIMMAVLIGLLNLYFYVLGNTNVDTVWLPMFERNLIISG